MEPHRSRYVCMVCQRARKRRWWERHGAEIRARCAAEGRPLPWALAHYARAVVALWRAGAFWQDDARSRNTDAAEAALEALARRLDSKENVRQIKREAVRKLEQQRLTEW